VAQRPKQVCRCCKKLADGAYCADHIDTLREAKREHDRKRRSDPLRKLYNTARWAAIRLIVLARDPLCMDGRVCECKALSTVVDHKMPARLWVCNGGDFFDESNLQGLCAACHNTKTAEEDGAFGHQR